MPVALTPPEPPPPLIPRRKRWTRDECTILESNGVWELEKLELVGGELLTKMGHGWPHARLANHTFHCLIDRLGRGRINLHAPIDVAPEDNLTNEPVPDLIVFTRPYETFPANPQPEDVLLVVEVSDTTLQYDLSVRAPLYSRAGIVEYWVLDMPNRRLIVHREPTPGGYQSVIAYSESESVAPLASPQHELPVGEIFA